jgi:hypothetical protein
MSPTKSPTKPTHTHSVFCVGMGAYGAHCVLFATLHQSPTSRSSMESSIDSTSIIMEIMDSEFESIRIRVNHAWSMRHAACLDQLRVQL